MTMKEREVRTEGGCLGEDACEEREKREKFQQEKANYAPLI